MVKTSHEEGLWARVVREAFLEEDALAGGLRDLEGTGQPAQRHCRLGKQPKQRPGGQGVVLVGAARCQFQRVGESDRQEGGVKP